MLLGKPSVEPASFGDERLFGDVDFAATTVTVTLSSQFKMYQIDLRGLDPMESEDVTYLAAVQINEGIGGRPVVVYLKGMLLDVNPPNEKYLLQQDESLIES
jgi:hypothetical protein